MAVLQSSFYRWNFKMKQTTFGTDGKFKYFFLPNKDIMWSWASNTDDKLHISDVTFDNKYEEVTWQLGILRGSKPCIQGSFIFIFKGLVNSSVRYRNDPSIFQDLITLCNEDKPLSSKNLEIDSISSRHHTHVTDCGIRGWCKHDAGSSHRSE